MPFKKLYYGFIGVYVLQQQFVTGAYGNQLFAFQWFCRCNKRKKHRVRNLVEQTLQELKANRKHDI